MLFDPVYELALITRIDPKVPKTGEDSLRTFHYQAPTVAVLDVGWMDDRSQDETFGVDKEMPLTALDLLAAIIAARPPFSAVFTD